ncbi:MAG: conjugal transfer protein TraH, partial [Burkholderiales bacterium]|nr:conjugal transfer protein TraH [Burkholderiales bacterium]
MKKIVISILLSFVITASNADVNQAVDNFFNTITADVSQPAIVQNQSAGVLSIGGIATRSQVINLTPMQFTPPSFNASCGNINFYSGSLAFMTNTDQLVQFMQNTLMTAGITAVMTALKAVTPNIAGTLQSMFDASQKMLNMFNNSCQLGMALGNSADSWMYDRLAKGKAQAHSDSSDASSAEINSSTGGSSGSSLADKMNEVTKTYHDWVNKNASMNPTDNSGIVGSIANKYGSVIWKGIQALHLYSLPIEKKNKTKITATEISDIANLVISLTGDLIIYSPGNDGTGLQARVLPPTITDVQHFITSTQSDITTYKCSYFHPDFPGECNGTQVDLATIDYPTNQFNGGIIKKIQVAMTNIQDHFTSGTSLNNDDLLIIAISPVPIFAIAQTLDDIGMSGSIEGVLNQYSKQIAFEILQRLINVSLNLAIQATTTRTNNDTQQTISNFVNSIKDTQNRVNSFSSQYIKDDPIVIL